MLLKARSKEKLSVDDSEVIASYLQAAFMNFQARLHHNVRGVFESLRQRILRARSSRTTSIKVTCGVGGTTRNLSTGRSFAITAMRSSQRLKDGAMRPPVADWNAFVGLRDPDDKKDA